MARTIFRLLFVTTACCWCKKYVFVQEKKDWPDARQYCREHYKDFLDLTSEEEEQAFKTYVNDDESKEGWIGIYWNKPTSKWKWSGGANVTYQNNLNLPLIVVGMLIAQNGYWTKDGWDMKGGDELHSFFCLNMTAVEEEKTWEGALEYCRKEGTNLTSLLSATETLEAQSEFQKSDVTDRMWIGLRFLGSKWLWVNGDPLSYEAWATGGDQDQHCPMLRRCVALTKNGEWEGRDCHEKLSFICG